MKTGLTLGILRTGPSWTGVCQGDLSWEEEKQSSDGPLPQAWCVDRLAFKLRPLQEHALSGAGAFSC